MKMSYVLLEILFICLWSSTLSLAFNDLFQSPLGCASYEPYKAAAFYTPKIMIDLNPVIIDALCRKEVILISFIFVSVLLYIAVLIVSLFRLLERINPNYAS